MPGVIHLLEFSGKIDYKTIDQLLGDLRKNRDFTGLHKFIRKRVYAVIVECLENIARHSSFSRQNSDTCKPFISVTMLGGQVVVTAGNPVLRDDVGKLGAELELINKLEQKELLAFYDSKISMDQHAGTNGAGLGFMIMKLKSGNSIEYKFTDADCETSFFEIKTTINQQFMRKLIIDQTSNSPKVVFDPGKNIYEISGESRPPDVARFYTDVLSWFDDYSRQLLKNGTNNEPVFFDLDFEYFNSSSAKYILDFCKKIADTRSRGSNIAVRWHYEDDDTDMLETGKEMSKMARFPFEYVTRVK